MTDPNYVNPNESLQEINTSPVAPTPTVQKTQTTPNATVPITTNNPNANLNLPAGTSVPVTTSSVAGTSSTPQTPSAPPISYMANATAAGLPGAPQPTASSPTPGQIGQQYQQFFNTVQGTQAPSTYPSEQIQQGTQPTTGNPILDGLVSSMAPIMNSLNQVISDINNPAITGINLQQEYQQLSQQYNLPGLNSQLMNDQNIMNGTQDDIAQEITAGGGTATQSQVLAMTSARNTLIMKQYNALATQYSAAQANVQAIMGYATTDQSNALQKESMTAGVTENMDSIYSQMESMANTMQQNATDNLNKVVTNIGYTGLAAQAQGDPNTLAYYEQLLNLAPGSLSSQTTLSQMDTYRQQQLALSQQRVVIQEYNAGLPATGLSPTGSSPATAAPGQDPTTSIDPTTLVRPPGVSANIPLQVSADDMQQYMQAQPKASIDPGTNNVVAPGVGYYVQQSDGSYVLKSAIPVATSVQGQYNSMLSAVKQAQQTPVSGSPLNKGRYSRLANSSLKLYTANPIYTAVSSAAPYLARIQAAMDNPNSISDADLADSLIKIETGGGQVTEAQLQTYFQGQTFADQFAVEGDKVTGTGGVLSPQQRQDLSTLANEVFSNYQTEYQNLYVQAMQNLQGQGIPLNYGGNLPDFSELIGNAQSQ